MRENTQQDWVNFLLLYFINIAFLLFSSNINNYVRLDNQRPTPWWHYDGLCAVCYNRRSIYLYPHLEILKPENRSVQTTAFEIYFPNGVSSIFANHFM